MRILVVDDNEDAALMLSYALSAKGHDARTAHDAASALQLAAEYQPQAALLDIGLPIMDGHELAVRMRKIPGLERILLIALTGYGQDSDRARTQAAGFDHHLVKPVDFAAIDAALASPARS
jgi:CheY-like chemotaxis protein